MVSKTFRPWGTAPLARRDLLRATGGLAVLIGGGSLLNACGGGGSSGSDSLTVLFPYNTTEERDAYMKHIQAYESQNDMKMSVQNSSWDDIDRIIQTRVAAGDYPDLMLATPDRISVFGNKLVDLKSSLPDDIQSKFSEADWQAVNINNKVTGLPRGSAVYAALYNVDYFEQAGISAPQTADEAWTWDELEAAAVSLQQKAGAKYGLQFGDPSFDGFIAFIYQRGGSLMNPDMSEAAIDSDAGVATLQWVADLHKEGIAAPGIFDGTSDGLQFFVSGISGIWLGETNNKITDMAAKMTDYGWSYMPLPQMEKNVTQLSPAQWAGFDNGKSAQSLANFVEFMTSSDVQSDISSATGGLPANLAAAEKTKWKTRPDLLPFFVEYGQAASDLQLQAEAVSPIYGAARPALLQELAKVAAGGVSPEQAAADMAQIINSQIAKSQG